MKLKVSFNRREEVRVLGIGNGITSPIAKQRPRGGSPDAEERSEAPYRASWALVSPALDGDRLSDVVFEVHESDGNNFIGH